MRTPLFPLLLAVTAALLFVAPPASATPEVEPNNQSSQAHEIPENATIEGEYSSTDVDWFLVRLPAAGTFNLTIDGYWAPVQFRYASNGTTVPAMSGPEAEGHVVSSVFWLATDVQIQLGPTYSSSPTTYSFQTRFSAGFAALEGPDEVEPNSLPGEAQPVANHTHYEGLLPNRFAFDRDYWLFDISEPGVLEITMDASSNTPYFFHAGNESPIYLGADYSGPNLRYGYVVQGSLSLLIRFEYSYYNTYGFNASFQPGFATLEGPGETEPNNNESTAGAATVNATVSGQVDQLHGDSDFWAFTVPGPGLVELDSPESIFIRMANVTGGPSTDVGFTWTGTVYRFGISVFGPANITVVVSADRVSLAQYNLTINYTSDFAATTGPDEVEPNHAPAAANTLVLNTPVGGFADNRFMDEDWWSLSITEPGILVLSLTNCCPAPVGLQVYNASNLTAPLASYWSQVVGGPTDFLLRVSAYYTRVSDYTLEARFYPGFALIEGPDEVEPNNERGDAQEIPLGANVSGLVSGQFNDHDFWHFLAALDGVAVVRVTSESSACYVSVETSSRGNVGSGNQPQFLFEISRGEDVFVDVWTFYGQCEYTFSVRQGAGYFILSEGAGEVEPNEELASATRVTAPGTYEGILDSQYDSGDWFRVHAPAGAVVQVRFEVDGSGYPFNLEWGRGEGLVQFSTTGPTPAPWSTLLLTPLGQDIAFRITGGGYYYPTYRVIIAWDETDIYADGEATLEEVAAVEEVGMTFTQRFGGSTGSPRTIDYTINTLYSGLICPETRLGNEFPGVAYEAGTVFDPAQAPAGRRFVVVAQGALTLHGYYGDCLSVVAMEEAGDPWSAYLYVLGTPATGDALTVAQACADLGVSDARAMLAMWAVTSAPNVSTLQSWDAERAVVEGANEILEHAGLSARLPLPPLPDVNGPLPLTNTSTNGTQSNNSNNPSSNPGANATSNQTRVVGAFEAALLGGAAGAVVGLGASLLLSSARAAAVRKGRAAPPDAAAPAASCATCGNPLRPGLASCARCGTPAPWKRT